jgi:hypothetical protein
MVEQGNPSCAAMNLFGNPGSGIDSARISWLSSRCWQALLEPLPDVSFCLCPDPSAALRALSQVLSQFQSRGRYFWDKRHASTNFRCIVVTMFCEEGLCETNILGARLEESGDIHDISLSLVQRIEAYLLFGKNWSHGKDISKTSANRIGSIFSIPNAAPSDLLVQANPLLMCRDRDYSSFHILRPVLVLFA